MNETCPMLCLTTVGTENTMSLCVQKCTEPDIKWTDPFLNCKIIQWDIVQFSHSVMSVSLRPHVLQNVRLPYPSPTLTQTHVYRVDDAIWAYGQWDAK